MAAPVLVYLDTSVYNHMLKAGRGDLIQKIKKARGKGRCRIIFGTFNFEEIAGNRDRRKAVDLFQLSRTICDRTTMLKLPREALSDEINAFLGSQPQPGPWYIGRLLKERTRMWGECCTQGKLDSIPSEMYAEIRQRKQAYLASYRLVQQQLRGKWEGFRGTKYEELWDYISRGEGLVQMVRTNVEDLLGSLPDEKVLTMTEHLEEMKTFHGLCRYSCAQIFTYFVKNKPPKRGDERDKNHGGLVLHFDIFVTNDGDFADILKLFGTSKPCIMSLDEFEEWLDSRKLGM